MSDFPIPAELQTIRDWVRWGASSFGREQLFFGHGTDNAFDEALMLVLHALELDYGIPEAFLDAKVTQEEKEAIAAILERRIKQREPGAYITGHMRFAGLDFIVNSAVLVPRSPIAELIHIGFEPWLEADSVNSVLDLCTGCGCIGIACAYAFEDAYVDLADISQSALEVAQQNIDKHHMESRVTAIGSDVFSGLEDKKYDLIVSNPPYVSTEEYETLPSEYHQEPKLGLECGTDGMDVVSRMLKEASSHLNPGGILVVEVGASAELLMAKYPEVPFLWIDFENGGDGVFVLTDEQLAEHQAYFDAGVNQEIQHS